MGLILVRYGELGLKGRNRGQFIRRLQANMKDCLKREGIPGRVDLKEMRLYVETEAREEALEALSRVFGIVSLSPVTRAAAELEAMKAEALRAALEAGLQVDRTFRVRSRRVDKAFPTTSPEIDWAVGGHVKINTGATVDLSSAADVTVELEVLRGEALVYGRRVAGPGGLPLGSQGRVVALISGGIDSPVAAWMMMKRGCPVISVHFAQNATERQKALDNCEVLSRYAYGWELRPVVEDHHEALAGALERLRELGAERWTCIFCKRGLLKRAQEIASEMGAHAVVMGDSLGQVASQTLENLEAVSHGMELPILRPLIGMDKIQIIELAKKIGTFEVSTREAEGCAYLPKNPLTRADIAKFKAVLAELEGR